MNELKIGWFLLLPFAAMVCLAAGPARIVVDTREGQGNFDDIQAAIDAASPGDLVHVNPGVYPGNLVMRAGIIVEGSGVDATSILPDRDDEPTVLFQDPDMHWNDSCLSSCTVRGSRADRGGGILVEAGGAPTIFRCRIEGGVSRYGGGICVREGSSPLVWRTTIQGCSAVYGGGIYLDRAGEELLLWESHLTGNKANHGAGLFAYQSQGLFRDNELAGNTASGLGGGVCFYHCAGFDLLENRFEENHASAFGGGLCLYFCLPERLESTDLIRNEAARGGGAYLYHTPASMDHGMIVENRADLGGGMAAAGNGELHLSRLNFQRNQGEEAGGGLWVDLSTPLEVSNSVFYYNVAKDGAGLRMEGAPQAVVTNNTWIRNHHPWGGQCLAITLADDVVALVLNNWFLLHHVDVRADQPGNPTLVDYNRFGEHQGWTEGVREGSHNAQGAASFVPGDPWCHITEHDPGRGQGIGRIQVPWVPEDDVDGEPRPLEGVDIGVDQYYE